MTEITHLTDLASRAVGGSVISTNDEFFVEKEHLIKPEAAVSCKGQSGNRGGIYDGWETRRRRVPGHDWVIVRLGLPGVIRSVTVDTAFFRGNYPDAASIEACSVAGYPSQEELEGPDIEWVEIVGKSACEGDTENVFPVSAEASFTHVRLNIYPDGGVARLRVHGEPVADPSDFAGLSLDLAALGNGGLVIDQSDNFFNPASNVISSGTARTTKDGWETKRRRGEGHDWLMVKLAAPGTVHQVGLDTSRYIGNSPYECALFACDARTSSLDDEGSWWPIVAKARVHSDILQRFRTESDRTATHVRLDIFPDGALARLHLLGYLSSDGAEQLALRWLNTIGDRHLVTAMENAGVSSEAAEKLVAGRPFVDVESIDATVGTVDSAAVHERLGLTTVEAN
jgi:allantoicase